MPACFQSAVPPKMRRNFRNRKIASVTVKGPAFSDPKGASRPSAEGKVSGEGEAGQPRGRGGGAPRESLHTFFSSRKYGPPRRAAKEKLDEIIIKCDNRKSGAFLWEKVIFIRAAGGV